MRRGQWRRPHHEHPGRHRRPRRPSTGARSSAPGTGTTGPTRRSTRRSPAVLFGPYMITVASRAAGCVDNRTRRAADRRSSRAAPAAVAADLPDQLRHALGSAFSCRSWARSPTAPRRKKWHCWPAFAWVGAAAAALLFFVTGRQLAARRRRRSSCANLCLGAARWSSTTRSSCRSPPRTSATGSPRAGGPTATSAAALLLLPTSCWSRCRPFGLGEGMAVRISMLSAAVWWAGFTIIPFLGICATARPPHVVAESGRHHPAELRPAVRDAEEPAATTR